MQDLPSTGAAPQRRRILVIDGHPRAGSLCAALAARYAAGARQAGHDVRELSLRTLRFDPLLNEEGHGEQALEPDLQAAQDALRWGTHQVWIFPNWWGGLPALLKGFIDRVLLPGFAFKYRERSLRATPLLPGRTAHLIVTMDSPPWYYRWVMCAPGLAQMKGPILAFCGIKPIRSSPVGPVRGSSPDRRQRWLAQAQAWGAAGR